jgi:hypothetical protein
MKSQNLIIWISLAGIIGILFGVFYAFFGLNGLPVYQKLVSPAVYIPWSNGLYGSVFIGFSVLLFFVGRHAFKNKDKVLMKALLYGLASWLIVEAFFSFLYGVYFNIGVDVFLMIFLGFPLVVGIRSKKQ